MSKIMHTPVQLEPIEYKCPQDIVDRAKAAIGLSIVDIDKSENHWRLNPKNKGAIGQVLEESWFRYAPNGIPTADFAEFGLELKSFAYNVRRDKTKSAKERLVANIINFNEEYKRGFFESSFLRKCRGMVLVTFEYKKDLYDVVISGAGRYDFSLSLLQDLEKDYYIIIEKIKQGKAHEISSADTELLEACPKGSNKESSQVSQPFSVIKAQRRAFALKPKLVTRILNEIIFAERILKTDKTETSDLVFEAELKRRVEKFVGVRTSQIIRELGLEASASAKHINELIFNKMLGVTKASQSKEFITRHYIPKTIRINKKRGINESMAFRTFDFRSVAQGDWEHSIFYREITSRFVFPIFQELNNGDYIFKGLYFWSIPKEDLKEARWVWERTKSLMNKGLRIWDEGNRTKNNLPSLKESRVSHVRPHAQTKKVTELIPDGSGRRLTKQAFWLNKSYVLSQILPLIDKEL